MHRRIFPPRLLTAYFLLLLLGMGTGQGTAQESHTSPVFKDYRPPRPGAIVEQSDVTYQLWHTFDLMQRAGGGDMLAQQELAVRYLTGRGVKADTARGAFWTIKAAAWDMLPARFNLGILFTNGWGLDWNPFEAYNQFLWCAERGMPESQYALATIFMEDLVVQKNWGEARRWLRAAMDSGYAPARTLLENMLQRGEPGAPDTLAQTPRDTTLYPPAGSMLPWAPVFLDFEADTGSSVEDAVLLADLLRESDGEHLRSLGLNDSVKRLEETGPAVLEAVKRSADAGSPEALTLLGRCHERGIGLPQDLVEAAALYVRAVRLDSPTALELLMKLLDDSEAVPLLRSRATSGDPAASFTLASLVGLRLSHPLLRNRTWITENEAVRLLQRAGARGFLPALVELGLWYYAGRLVPPDRDRALALWEDAAKRGSLEARVRLAVAGLESERPPGDSLLGFLAEAMESGSVLAQVALGYCEEKGVGVGRNSARAARLYRNAAQRGSQDAYRALLRMHDAIRPPGTQFEVREN